MPTGIKTKTTTKYMVQVSDKAKPYVEIIKVANGWVTHKHLHDNSFGSASPSMFRPCTKRELLEIAVTYDY